MDRFKCPLHGPIVPRNAVGQPTTQSASDPDAERLDPALDWQDPELLRDLEATMGLNMKVEKKRKGKRKHPGLTDIKETENTTRKRLGKKLFNRSAMKRVADELNRLEGRRKT